MLKACVFTTDIENIVDRKCNTHDNGAIEKGAALRETRQCQHFVF
jgi:hypothetical protein